jgi:hypothetical protein
VSDPPDAAASAYPATALGLEQLMADLLRTAGGDDEAAGRQLLASLVLPDAGAWFRRRFGDSLGERLAADYQRSAGRIHDMAALFRDLRARQRTRIVVESFDRPGLEGAVGFQDLALQLMRPPDRLFSVRFLAADEAAGFHLWSFVREDGAFRWIGKLQPLRAAGPARKGPDPAEYRRTPDATGGAQSPR